ncbi:CMGC/SRPK protein kinase [Capsaspora owczarzaki ATCC 30864]|uniref:non-specific serine/threonine protein kinase n=2 Tax=Capsaspora owczarzaki (strain ATCC 30864) TaxID=595528 RepID=A0A0D2VPU2_CAPO3|nr:CMGC/SRPK protein kinase [Capsaspora owczarzaki ATCC 30864]
MTNGAKNPSKNSATSALPASASSASGSIPTTAAAARSDRGHYDDTDDGSDEDSDYSDRDSEYLSENEEQEDEKDYVPGGYHFVQIHDVYNRRYHVIRKLGWGHFSTVWLCADLQTKEYVALKVVKSSQHYADAARDEIQLLRAVLTSDVNDPGRSRVVRLLDDFEIRGPNGTHVCMVFEVLGENLLKIMTRNDFKGISIKLVRQIAFQTLQALHYMHSKCAIIHTDLKPENILLTMPGDDLIKLVAGAEEAAKTRSGCATGKPRSTPAALLSDSSVKLSRAQKKRLKAKLKKKQAQQASTQSEAHVESDDGEASDDTIPMEVGSPPSSASFGPIHEHDESADASPVLGSAVVIPPYSILPQPPSGFELDVKIADLGNACWVHKHFTDDIQTRQYRSPEVLLGANYDTSADIWSSACLFFELLTGEFLFEPKTGRDYSRDEDHMALIQELVGKMPKHLATRGKFAKEIFNRNGELRHIGKLCMWGLRDVLVSKYAIDSTDADSFSSFLLPMLELNPVMRATAAQCLQHPFLAEERDIFESRHGKLSFE